MRRNDPANWQLYWEWLLFAVAGRALLAVLDWMTALGYRSHLEPISALGPFIDTVLTAGLAATVIPAMLAARDHRPDRFAKAWRMTYTMTACGVLALIFKQPLLGLAQLIYPAYTAYRLRLPDDARYPIRSER